MLYRGAAKAVDGQYKTFDYESWSQISEERRDETVGLVNSFIKIPWVVMLVTYDRIPKTQVRFTRANIFARDRNTCQYRPRSPQILWGYKCLGKRGVLLLQL